MARIKGAIDNQLTEEVVNKMVEKDEERVAAEKAYQAETDDIIKVVKKAKTDRIHPDYNSLDTMVRLVAEVPQSVAVEAVRQQKFTDRYPCITSYALGLISGVVLMVASVLIGGVI